MASKRLRSRAHRRERRLAKCSGWQRPGKVKMGGTCGHGTTGSGRPVELQGQRKTRPTDPSTVLPRLTAKLKELAKEEAD